MSNTWVVSVKTGNIENAGTSTTVYIRLHGETGHTPAIELDNSDDNFERNKVDTFTVTLPDVGTLTSMDVWHDNTGHKPGWFLDEITLTEQYTTVSYLFPCHNWLATTTGDHQISRTLYPV